MLRDGTKKDKIMAAPKVTAKLLDDLLNIEAVVVILREKSLSIYDSWVGVHTVDAQLFSGLISAITAMIAELGGKTDVRERHSFLEFSQTAGDEDLIIWGCLGEFVAITLILRRRSSKDLRRILASLVYEYESALRESLAGFTGYLDDIFEKSGEIISSRLHFEFLSPMRLIKPPEECPEECRTMAQVISEEQRPLAASEGLYLRELVAVAVRSLGNLPYRDILNQVIQLVRAGMLGSVEEEGKVRRIDLAIEAIDEVLAQEEQVSVSDDPSSSFEEGTVVVEQTKKENGVEETSALSTELAELANQLEETEQLTDTTSDLEPQIEPSPTVQDDKRLDKVLEILTNQKIPDIPVNLIVDILKREITYSEGMQKILEVETSEIALNQVTTLVKGQIKSKIALNALEGPQFDTKFRNFTLRVSISKVNGESAIFMESVVSS
ncbi:MAG: hypothetical protein ACE5OZ_22720 [Candidatus Heimdallarchaeota archaeon]